MARRHLQEYFSYGTGPSGQAVPYGTGPSAQEYFAYRHLNRKFVDEIGIFSRLSDSLRVDFVLSLNGLCLQRNLVLRT